MRYCQYPLLNNARSPFSWPFKSFAISGLFLLALSTLAGCANERPATPENIIAPRISPTIQMANKININQLINELTRLKNHETEYDFIGITSNGTDCLYFALDGEKFNLEFEAIIANQKPFLEKLKNWADSNHFRSIMTTYNNQPKYPSAQPAPVIRIETHSSLEDTAKFGTQIEKEVFGNPDTTVYEVVP